MPRCCNDRPAGRHRNRSPRGLMTTDEEGLVQVCLMVVSLEFSGARVDRLGKHTGGASSSLSPCQDTPGLADSGNFCGHLSQVHSTHQRQAPLVDCQPSTATAPRSQGSTTSRDQSTYKGWKYPPPSGNKKFAWQTLLCDRSTDDAGGCRSTQILNEVVFWWHQDDNNFVKNFPRRTWSPSRDSFPAPPDS